MALSEQIKADEAEFPVENIPEPQKVIATEWRDQEKGQIIILPELSHNSDYVDPLSPCKGRIRLHGFTNQETTDTDGECTECGSIVTVSRAAILIAKGLV
jgi:hypothetical protein